MSHNRFPLFVLSLGSIGAAVLPSASVLAQSTTSRPVVQPLPPKEVDELRDALRALDRAPNSVDALLNAGYASIKVNDLDAAMGYFGRAEAASPTDQRVKQAQAMVFLRSGRPVEALQLFARAESAGATNREFLSDRALAYDMVGDQVRAQALYRVALVNNPNDNDTIRRMAISQAISGNEAAFLDTLRPLVDRQDFPAFRAQAFGLAIMGENQRAKDVTEAVMPAELARKIVPYLEYMPRLTKAQQAAAANLGIFPRAADIGREDPKIAEYVNQSVAPASMALVKGADSKLEPTGEPLGRTAQATPAAPNTTPQPKPAPVVAKAPEQVAVVGPSFDLGKTNNSPPTPPAPVRITRVEPVAPPPQAKPDPDFASAFADLGKADTRNVAKADEAVDLAAIVIPREAKPAPPPPPKPVAKPAPPAPKKAVVPERYWVQLGTGSAVEPLKFDWRRLVGKVPDQLRNLKAHTAPYGAKHRLLAGPFTDKGKRDEVVRALTEKGLGVLPFTSPEGMEIQEIK